MLYACLTACVYCPVEHIFSNVAMLSVLTLVGTCYYNYIIIIIIIAWNSENKTQVVLHCIVLHVFWVIQSKRNIPFTFIVLWWRQKSQWTNKSIARYH